MSLRLPDHSLEPVLPTAAKRDHDSFLDLSTSSDPPLFSSDGPTFESSAQDYDQPHPKRQHQGPWFEMDEVKLTTRQPGGHPTRQRTSFRKFDSGVYLGSDDSADDSGPFTSQGTPISDLKRMGLDGVEDSDIGFTELRDDDSAIITTSPPVSLMEKAMQTIEDPGNYDGPVFPYWQKQPESLDHFHMFQKYAHDRVLAAVDRGEEVVDLSNGFLTQVRPPTLRPLRFYIKQEKKGASHAVAHRPKYQRLTPSLRLFLINNDLEDFPSELYHLANLEVLSLRNNSIAEILPTIDRLTSLKELNLASNALSFLPYTLLSLLRNNLQILSLSPNPFLRLQPSTYHRLPVPKNFALAAPPKEPELVASTATAFLSITGDALRCYPPTPTQTPSHWPNPTEIRSHTDKPPEEERRRTPSLLELSLRAISAAPELSQLPFHIPDDAPHIKDLLKRTYELKQSGGQKCTVCENEFVVPRTEWVEWWAMDRQPIPFVRRGCSWQCFEEREGQAAGWSSGGGPGGMEQVEREK